MSAVILGGGISGLSAGYYLSKTFPKYSVTLLEASNRLGGWIKSNTLDNKVIFEEGPRTLRPHGPAALNTLTLIEEIGLKDDVVPIYSTELAAKNRMIYVNGQLHVLPSTLSSLFKTVPPFSKPLFLHLLQDVFTSKKSVEDESIYEFTNRRFGKEVADYLVSALICGICAGNSKEISVNFLMKTLFEYEQQYGSIYKGILKNIFNKSTKKTAPSGLALKARQEKWSVYSFKNGLETLTKTLAEQVKKNVSIELNAKCQNLQINPEKILLQLENDKFITASKLISSISSENLGYLLEKQHPELSMLLKSIQCVTVAVVNLQYDKKVISKEGFGFLVPPKEKLPILGVTYDSCCFPKGDKTVLTVMIGGAWFEEMFGNIHSEQQILQIALEQLKSILNIFEPPVQFKVQILEKCIPQYKVGHNKNIQEINKYIHEKKLPLYLCGSSYYGVGVNDVILSSKNAVAEIC